MVCQQLCEAEPTCKHFYYEFEMGKHECFLKAAFGFDVGLGDLQHDDPELYQNKVSGLGVEPSLTCHPLSTRPGNSLGRSCTCATASTRRTGWRIERRR